MKKGFTLIELLVAIAIFSILVAIGVGGFTHALRTQREVAALIATQSNISVALEQMTREIRTGYLFCTNPGSEPGTPATQNSTCLPSGNQGCQINGVTKVWTCTNILDFYNADNQRVDYKVVNGELSRSENDGAFIPITADTVNVSSSGLVFTIFGNTEGDNWPPRITISLAAVPSSTDPALESDIINLQTTVSAREIDCTQGDPVQC
jgi:prepilin-type N-terminal cleavage/methylation domain-containing protein